MDSQNPGRDHSIDVLPPALTPSLRLFSGCDPAAASASTLHGVHFDEPRHRALGLALAETIFALPLIDHESATAA